MFQLTPAQSKSYNQPCVIFDFFDKHDIWHFLSATSMFFSFMVSIVSVAHVNIIIVVKFCLCIIKHHAVRLHGRAELECQTFLNLALDGSRWSPFKMILIC